MWRYTLYLLFLNLSVVAGDKHFFFSPRLEAAYEDIIDLKLQEAEVELNLIKVLEPDNLLTYHIENYIDFFQIFIGEKESDYEAFKKRKKLRLQFIKQGDVESPYYLFSQAEVLLQSALLRLKFEEYFGAFNDVSKAYQLLEYNQKTHPEFIANRKSLGILHAMVGSIPESFRWGIKLLGMDGTIEQGRSEIESVLDYSEEHNFVFHDETVAMYAYVLLHLCKQEEEAWQLIESSSLDPKTSLLACFVSSNIALRTGRTDEAIELLSHKPVGLEYYPFPQLEYMQGMARLYRLDPLAKRHLEAFLRWFSGRNYIKDTYQKLAWYDLIFNEGLNYNELMGQCARRGFQQVDEDKSAHQAAVNGDRPHIGLLKARLLFDGGYYEKAFDQIHEINRASLTADEILELDYRKARILHALLKYEEALRAYYDVLKREGESKSYMIANSALQSGLIHEKRGDLDQAAIYFNRCLDQNPDQYEMSLNQKAKAGLDRVYR